VILDKGNHCVRELDFETDVVSTIAGICGESGFRDGPLGKALFNSPDRLGLTSSGQILIFDEGNRYIRILIKRENEWIV
jgi:hypothetical protein